MIVGALIPGAKFFNDFNATLARLSVNGPWDILKCPNRRRHNFLGRTGTYELPRPWRAGFAKRKLGSATGTMFGGQSEQSAEAVQRLTTGCGRSGLGV